MEPIPQITPIPPVSSSDNRYNGTRLPVLRIDAVTVTRNLPPSVSSVGTASVVKSSLSRPTIEMPTASLDYPDVIDVPDSSNFEVATDKTPSNDKGKKSKAGDDGANKAKALTPQLPPAIIQPQPPAVLYTNQSLPSLTAAPAAPPAAQPVAVAPQPSATPTGATVTLPLLGTLPLPSKENVALASTTAVTATFVAVLGKAAFEASLEGAKPLLRMLAIRYKKMRKRDLSDDELQLEFAFAAKRKGKRTFGEILKDTKEYFSENFFEDLIG